MKEATVIALKLKSISFNTNGDCITGSIHCRKDYDVPIDPVARVKDNTITPIGVFIPSRLGPMINLYIEVENDGPDPVNAIITATETSNVNIFGDVHFQGTNFPVGRTIKLQTRMPSAYLRGAAFHLRTQKRSHKWKWAYQESGCIKETDLIETNQIVYILHGLPHVQVWVAEAEAYADNEKRYVWTSLLDICCQACDNMTPILGHRPSNLDEHIKAFEWELNNCGTFRYDGRNGACFYVSKSFPHNTVKLQKYVKDRLNSYANKLNCTDCASLVAIQGLACGLAMCTLVMNGGNPNNGFACNPVIAIGEQIWAVPFGHGFSYHEVAIEYTGAVAHQNTPIYDACLQVDDGQFPQIINGVKRAALSGGRPFKETPATVVNVPPAVPYGNNFYRERLVGNGATCDITFAATQAGIAIIVGFDNLQLYQRDLSAGEKELEQMMKYCGTDKNPLPVGGMYEGWEQMPERLLLEQMGALILAEDYGRNRVYELTAEEFLRVEITYAFHHDEAWTLLLNARMSVTNPNVRECDIGDASYAIDDTWVAFAVENTIIQISGDRGVKHAAAKLAETFKQTFNERTR